MTTEQIDRWWPLIFIGIMLTVFGTVGFGARWLAYDGFVNTCLDNDGTPVKMMTYTKGYGDGWACVKIQGKVERK